MGRRRACTVSPKRPLWVEWETDDGSCCFLSGDTFGLWKISRDYTGVGRNEMLSISLIRSAVVHCEMGDEEHRNEVVHGDLVV